MKRLSTLVCVPVLFIACTGKDEAEQPGENTAPTCAISAPQSEAVSHSDETVSFLGTATDVDEDDSGLGVLWVSDQDGDLNTSAPDSNGGLSFDQLGLSVATHLITLTVTDTDGETCTTELTHTVENTAPVVDLVTLSPVSADTNTVLSATVTASDIDPLDTLTYSYTWFSGDSVLVDTSDTLDGASAFKKGETISVEVVANDGLVDSLVVRSEAITIVNTVPEAPAVSIQPEFAKAGLDDLFCQIDVEASDSDDDPIDYSFLWTVDGEVYTGAVETTVHTGDTVAASEAVSRQVWGCTVTPNDGEADGPSATSDDAIIVRSCYELACADAKWTGESAGDRLGQISAVGDVNGDGFDDVLIGAHGEDTHGYWTGAAYLVLGSSAGFTDMSISGAEAKLIGEAGKDYASRIAGAGDINGDGYDDVLVGASGHDSNAFDAGATYLIYGSSTGIADMSLADADAKLTGEAIGDYAGTPSSTAGDINGDGFDDILVGARGENTVPSSSGAVYLILGSSVAITDMDLSDADVKITGEGRHHGAGGTVSAADINGDGFDDVLIGAYGEDTKGDYAGAAYVVLGSSSGLADMSLSDADTKLTGEAAWDRAGLVSTAGDVNGDGYDDVLVGAREHDDAGSNSGAAYLVLGSSTGISHNGLSKADAKFTGEAKDDAAGQSAATAGDMNNDGYADILIGANKEQTYGYYTGAAYLLLGTSSGIASMSLSSADAKMVGEASGDYGGAFVSTVGDLDNDGYSDFVIGASGNDEAGSSAGAVYVFYGWDL